MALPSPVSRLRPNSIAPASHQTHTTCPDDALARKPRAAIVACTFRLAVACFGIWCNRSFALPRPRFCDSFARSRRTRQLCCMHCNRQPTAAAFPSSLAAFRRSSGRQTPSCSRIHLQHLTAFLMSLLLPFTRFALSLQSQSLQSPGSATITARALACTATASSHVGRTSRRGTSL